jgi:hypothetical protein
MILQVSTLALACLYRANNIARCIYNAIGDFIVDAFVGANHLFADLGNEFFTDLFGDIAVNLGELQTRGEIVIFSSVSKFIVNRLIALGWEIQQD